MFMRNVDKLVDVPMVRIIFDDPCEFEELTKLADEMGFDKYAWPMQMLRYLLYLNRNKSNLDAANDE